MADNTGSLAMRGRLAGVFFLLAAITTGFSLGYVRSNLIVFSDAVTTATNLAANQSMFRMAIVSTILSAICLWFFGLVLFEVLRTVDRKWSLVFLTSILIGAGIAAVNSLNNLGALLLVGRAEYLSAFQPAQSVALMMTFLRLNNFGIGLAELFSAPYLFALGLIVVRSGIIPRVVGIALLIFSLAFPVNTFSKILAPEFYPVVITQLTMLLGALAGIPLMLWLLIKGVREP